jgi:hypothetical protein
MARAYRVLTVRVAGMPGRSFLHLVGEDSEASLCGLPRAALGAGRVDDDLVCPICIEWLPKRRAASSRFQRPATI